MTASEGSIKVDGRFVGPCASCGSQMWLPIELYNSAKRSEKIGFFCPYGHPQMFPKGDTTLDIVRRERDQLAQRIAEKDDLLKQQAVALAKLQQTHNKAKRQIKRLDHGVCAHCSRTFMNLQRHMKTKHPKEMQ